MARVTSRVSKAKSLYPIVNHDLVNLTGKAKHKYKTREVKVELHPDHPVASLKCAEDAVYRVLTRAKDSSELADWYLVEQGMFPALLKSLKC